MGSKAIRLDLGGRSSRIQWGGNWPEMAGPHDDQDPLTAVTMLDAETAKIAATRSQLSPTTTCADFDSANINFLDWTAAANCLLIFATVIIRQPNLANLVFSSQKDRFPILLAGDAKNLINRYKVIGLTDCMALVISWLDQSRLHTHRDYWGILQSNHTHYLISLSSFVVSILSSTN
ncbi:hypothetical protein KEM48_006029, partial [Puccinia striiformis f. sp. tritici PST-130]